MSLELRNEYNRATAYLDKGQWKKALPIFKKCLGVYKFKEAYVNLGNCYRLAGQEGLVMDCYKTALLDNIPSLDPDPIPVICHALNNLGLTYYYFGDDVKAIHYYKKAIGLNDKFWEAWWNCSTATLRMASSGDTDKFASGWEMYNARFLKAPPVKLKNNKENLIYWDGVSSGSSICVLAEQGIGDDIMWGRYLSMLPFDEVYVQCDVSVEPLFPRFKCVRDAVECDANIAYPMCSLAAHFNDGIPIAGDWLRGKFDTRSFPSDKLNVGIVWAGSASHANDSNRSVAIGRFNRFSNLVNLYSLTPGFTSTKHVTSLGIKDWTDTAECINGLDLVMGVDTSVMHLCGALGCEGWLLQPRRETDFRWGNGVGRSLWYSSIEIFNNNGSWEDTFDSVEIALREKLYEKC